MNKDTNNQEKLTDLEKYLPTIDDIKSEISINILSINKYFCRYRNIKKHIFISGAYIIFTELHDMYIGSSINILERIKEHIRSFYRMNISISEIYIYETDEIDARRLESWLINILSPGLNIYYPNKSLLSEIRHEDIKISKLIIKRRRITKPNSRNQIFIGLDIKLLEGTIFEPGSHVYVIYEKDRITIAKDINEIKI